MELESRNEEEIPEGESDEADLELRCEREFKRPDLC